MATAQTGSTRAAASRVARSQSATSAALAELEQDFGVACSTVSAGVEFESASCLGHHASAGDREIGRIHVAR